jgi:hypothetical protein
MTTSKLEVNFNLGRRAFFHTFYICMNIDINSKASIQFINVCIYFNQQFSLRELVTQMNF